MATKSTKAQPAAAAPQPDPAPSAATEQPHADDPQQPAAVEPPADQGADARALVQREMDRLASALLQAHAKLDQSVAADAPALRPVADLGTLEDLYDRVQELAVSAEALRDRIAA